MFGKSKNNFRPWASKLTANWMSCSKPWFQSLFAKIAIKLPLTLMQLAPSTFLISRPNAFWRGSRNSPSTLKRLLLQKPGLHLARNRRPRMVSFCAQRLLNPSYATGAKQRTRRLHKLPQTRIFSVLRAAKPGSQEKQGWDEFLSLLPPNLDEKWDNLLDGMNQYLGVLQGLYWNYQFILYFLLIFL